MSEALELYKAFIDGLVERKDSITASWVKSDGFPKTEDFKEKNEFLAALSLEQKDIIARCFNKNILPASILSLTISMT